MAKDMDNLENEFENEDMGLDENGMIELVDEEGNTELFELIASFPRDEEQYLAVAVPSEEEDPEEREIFFLKIVEDEDGNDAYLSLDEGETDDVFEYFLTLVESEDEE